MEGRSAAGRKDDRSATAKRTAGHRPPETEAVSTSPVPTSGEAVAAPGWHAIRTRSRHEYVVSRQLVERGIESYLPTIAKATQWKDRRKTVEWPLFPGYCFGRFQRSSAREVLRCVGVAQILAVHGDYATIPSDEIDAIRTLTASTVPFDACLSVSEGAAVEIVGGPLKRLVGRVLKNDTRHAVVVLSVNLIGQGARVELPATYVRPL